MTEELGQHSKLWVAREVPFVREMVVNMGHLAWHLGQDGQEVLKRYGLLAAGTASTLKRSSALVTGCAIYLGRGGD
jgi:hypothetical protein